MVKQLIEKKERKVEYVELIYDLIFVYIIGRNNSLLHHLTDGFIDPVSAFAYVLCTLAAIQIWNFSTYYVNIYGRHCAREHIFLFLNMFLLYFIGEGTRADWQGYHTMYHVAWALILINIGVQYLIELRSHNDPESRSQISRMCAILFGETALVLSAIAEFEFFATSFMSLAAIIFGMAAVFLFGQRKNGSFVDFSHLSERAMLYVVFTFGEMVIAVSSYFGDGISPNKLYFAFMAFVIVAGLFLSYGVFYDRVIDRERQTNGLIYMLIHIFIIFTLNNITNSLEFMRDEEVNLIPKILLLVTSFVMFYVFLFMLGGFAKSRCCLTLGFFLTVSALAAAFVALMFIFRENMYVNIAVSALFVYSVFAIIYRRAGKI
ncbi:MAG: low temperature requirement protein A [Ruminococcus sp.]|nr:low temperature requirement protein A [Ruminococcus sp.]